MTEGRLPILWQLRGEKYVLVSRCGPLLVSTDCMAGGVLVSVYDSLVGGIDRNVSLRANSLPDAQAGVGNRPALNMTLVMAPERAAPARETHQAAGALAGAGLSIVR
ncbi:hypothetical protein Q0M94_10510 [Deinococcus radiomollis]|uniref:hypothetical protein n=1 Tax=Deinococcus radiomollis TaxID=468916 RepID=UPI00389199CC